MARITGAVRVLDPVKAIGSVAFLAPLLTVYVPLSMAIVLPVGAVLLLTCRRINGLSPFRFDWPVVVVLTGFLIVAALSVLWSHSPALSLDKLSRTTMAMIAGLVFITALKGLDGEVANRVSSCFLAGMGIALVLIIAERLTGGLMLRIEADQTQNMFINQFNRPLAILSILIWPAVVILAQQRRVWGIGAIALFACILLAFSSGAAAAAIGAGAVVFTAVYIFPRMGAIVVGVGLAAGVLLAPAIDSQMPAPKQIFESIDLPRSAYHRLLIWEFATARIDERPILGWGLNTSRAIPGGQKNLDVSEKALPLHPHNAALQWRLELGILGSLFGAALFLVSTEMARRYAAGRVARAGAVAAIVSTSAIAMLSFGAWQTWWVSSIFLIAGFTILVCRRRSPG
jgi:exopolysaccharide production protein ExoQ